MSTSPPNHPYQGYQGHQGYPPHQGYQPHQPYQTQQPHPQQQPYGRPLHAHPPRRVPNPAGQGRRLVAATLDLALAVSVPYVLARGEEGRPLTALAVLTAVSFLNQVLLTALFGASAGKLVTGIRVIRATDGRRAGFWRAAYRWLCGLCWLPLQPYYGLRAFFRGLGGGGPARGTVTDNDDGELYHADLAGLRYARRADLVG
ncbi:RDD family protein [Streptomyces sp. NPDC012888]|uniref:RDD family protein n=1 Tax=Streptomyces sp. NPDC012888 TaxID=3364855 RepID=UPI0036AA1F3F